MNKRLLVIGMMVLLIIPTSPLIIFANPKSNITPFHSMDDTLDNWTYFKVIYLDNPSNNYQILINVSKYSGGDVNCNGHCKDDFGDIRFIDVDNSTVLNYWIEKKVDGSYVWFWVKLSSDIVTDRKICIYYGNPSATSVSNGDATFLWFDDFSTDTSGQWDKIGDEWGVDWLIYNTVYNSALHNARLRSNVDCIEIDSSGWAGSISQGMKQEHNTDVENLSDIRYWYSTDWSASENRPSSQLLSIYNNQQTNSGSTPVMTEGVNGYVTEWLYSYPDNIVRGKIWDSLNHLLWNVSVNSNIRDNLRYIIFILMDYHDINGGGSSSGISYDSIDKQLIVYCEGCHYSPKISWLELHYSWMFLSKYEVTEPNIIFVGDENLNQTIGLVAWWDNDWHYRKQILIYHSQVNDNLYNFPVLISNTSFDFAKHAQLDGDDFVFTNDYGLKLHHEIESYTHTSGELVAWVNVTSVSSTEDTILWLYYGNMNCDNQQNIHGTWNSEYKAVWHLDDNTRTTIKDSTSNNHPGTKKASNEPTEVKGFISKAQNFDGNNDYIKHGDILDEVFTGTNAQFTVSCWMKMTTYSSQACMVGKHGDSNQNENNREWILYCLTNPTYTGNLPTFVFYANYDLISSWNNMRMYIRDTQYKIDVWYYVTSTYDATLSPENRGKVFINGTSDVSSVFGYGTGSIGDGTAHLSIGAYVGQSESAVNSPFPGVIDEVRISKVIRSNAWINTSYKNQQSPSSFMSIGKENSSSEIASAGSLSDGTGDVYYWTGVGTTWAWQQNFVRNNIDITSIYATVQGEKITISMTVAGTIQDNEKFGYYIYYNTSDTNYWVMMMGGTPTAMGIRQGGGSGAYSSGEATFFGNTISAEFDVLGDTESEEIWGYAAEWSEVGPDAVNGEWWGDWAPNTKFIGEIEDDVTPPDDEDDVTPPDDEDDVTPPDDEDNGTDKTSTPNPTGTPIPWLWNFLIVVLIVTIFSMSIGIHLKNKEKNRIIKKEIEEIKNIPNKKIAKNERKRY